MPVSRLWWVLSLFVATALTPASAQAQYFGRNKVQYEAFDFRILATEHFDIYHDARSREGAIVVGQLAERWYARLSVALDHRFEERQPLILYGSHPEFAQTNVISTFLGEGIGGVTESRRRRIVMPFAAGLRETNHVLGHELVHAFQFAIAERLGRSPALPLWFAEGMAEYLSLGPADPLTAMWLRDAARHGRLPTLEELDRQRVAPYRFGHALWAYLAGRFGEPIVGRILKAKPTSDVIARIASVTEIDEETLSRDWHHAVRELYGDVIDPARPERAAAEPLIGTQEGSGRLNVAPALSPDGRRLIFLSERDQFSIDVFLADAATGRVVRKLLTTATDPTYEGVQAINSAGAWDPEGTRFALAAVRGGRPVVTILRVESGAVEREIAFDRLGEVMNPAWSPDGRHLAFTGLQDGMSDLFSYDLDADRLHRLTDDPFADLQPSWAPDGARLLFVTDRFTTDLENLRFGSYRLALVDPATGSIRATPALEGARQHIDPQWAPDGRTVYFIADPEGIPNLFRLDFDSGEVRQLTNVPGAVSGLTSLSPALSVSRDSNRVVVSVFDRGRFGIRLLEGADLEGMPHRAAADRHDTLTTRTATLAAETHTAASGDLSSPDAFSEAHYNSRLSLDGIGSPYLMSGGGSFGTFVRGGMSLYFGDMLGNRKLGAAVEVSNRLADFAGQLRYLDRESRWNWGAVAEQVPYVRNRLRRIRGGTEEAPTLTRRSERLRQTHRRVAGVLAYPFNRSDRIEFEGGIRQIGFDREVADDVYAASTGRLLSESDWTEPAAPTVTLLETSAALVRDTAVLGPTSPILGSRYRFEVSPTVGALSFATALFDYRKYIVPVRPFTIAGRLLHIGRYGGDADDGRLVPLFLGYPSLVRGYRAGSFTPAECNADGEPGECTPFEQLFGSRLLVANLELRFPVLGLRAREFRYGPLPIEGLVFTDLGVAWTAEERPRFAGGPRRFVRSIGTGVRLNAGGMIFEFDLVRPLDRAGPGWTLSFNFRPGF